MIRPIIRWPDPILRKVCEPIAVDDRARQIMADLVETLLASDGVGLAAPQIGEAVRIIAVRDSDSPEVVHVIANPRWARRSGIKLWSAETCLSEPATATERHIVRVKRDSSVEIDGVDAAGNFTSLVARVALSIRVQHEMDHLEGICIWNRVSQGERVAAVVR